jgi:hypothetical protein
VFPLTVMLGILFSNVAGNPDLTPNLQESLLLVLKMAFFNNRLNIDATY